MSITRHGAQGNKARRTTATICPGGGGGWVALCIGSSPMVDGQLVAGDILTQSRQAILNLLAVLQDAGMGRKMWCVAACGSMILATFTPSHRL